MELRQTAAESAPQLVTPGDFGALRVVVEGDRPAALRSLRQVGVTGDTEHVWIPVCLLRALAGDAVTAEWEASLEAMLAYASSRGWYDEKQAAVRAHIVYQ
jgi:hypothetical protein